MRLRIGCPRSLLVVAPHPDDEAIGAHTLIARMRRRGVAVTILIVSDGAGSHRSSAAWPRRRLVQERRRETRIVMRRVGVTADRVLCLDQPDGRLAEVAATVRQEIARVVRALPRPLLALVPTIEDDHPDHRVVAIAARPQAGVRWLAYPVWPAGRHLRGGRSLALTAQERLAKRVAIRSYRTQTGRITDDPHGFAMTTRQIAAFSGPREMFVGRG